MAPSAPARRGGSSVDGFGWSALRHRAFQVFFLGMFSVNTGGFVYITALGWYVLAATGSPAAVGLAYTANGVPQLLLTMHAGVFTDRLGARRMVAIGVGAAGLGMASLALVALMPNPPLELILLGAALAGGGYAVAGPGSMSIVSELVPPDAMSSSVALNWLQQNVARISGGIPGGVLLAFGSPSLAFLVAGVLNAAPAFVVMTVRLRPGSADRLAVPASSILRPSSRRSVTPDAFRRSASSSCSRRPPARSGCPTPSCCLRPHGSSGSGRTAWAP